MKFHNPYLIFIILVIIYIFFSYGVTITNDSVTNIEQITALNLWSRSSHFSFHLFGIIFYLIFTKVIGLNAVTSIEIMLAVFSASAAVALYQIVLKKFNNFSQAIITVIIYSLASGVFRFSCQVEYLILVPSLGIISLYFYSKGQNLIAGIIFGLGLLTSVLLVLFTPMFLLFTSFRELFKKQNIIFTLSTIFVFFTVNSFTYRETINGTWSYGGEIEFYKQVFGEINYLRPIAILVYGYLRSFNFMIILMPMIFYYLYKNKRELFFLVLITILIHLPVAIPEARYGGYQMTAYPIIAISAGYYVNSLLFKRRLMVYLIIVLYVFINFFIVLTERSFFNDLEYTYIQLSKNLDKNSILIVYQASKPIKKFYAPNLLVYDVKSNYQDKLAKYYPGSFSIDLSQILKNNNTVYLLESGQSMPDDHLKLLVSNFTKRQGAKVKGFALERVQEIDPSIKTEKLKGYPLDVYKLTKRK